MRAVRVNSLGTVLSASFTMLSSMRIVLLSLSMMAPALAKSCRTLSPITRMPASDRIRIEVACS